LQSISFIFSIANSTSIFVPFYFKSENFKGGKLRIS